jgi:hypothetical protein
VELKLGDPQEKGGVLTPVQNLTQACSVMRCGVWLLRFATLLSVAATAPLHVISTFLEDLALLQQWRSVTLVHCSGE